MIGLGRAVADALSQRYAMNATATAEQEPVGVGYLRRTSSAIRLPRIGTDADPGLLGTPWSTRRRLARAQIEDFDHNVSRHLAFHPEAGLGEPTEIKRLIDAYV